MESITDCLTKFTSEFIRGFITDLVSFSLGSTAFFFVCFFNIKYRRITYFSQSYLFMKGTVMERGKTTKSPIYWFIPQPGARSLIQVFYVGSRAQYLGLCLVTSSGALEGSRLEVEQRALTCIHVVCQYCKHQPSSLHHKTVSTGRLSVLRNLSVSSRLANLLKYKSLIILFISVE